MEEASGRYGSPAIIGPTAASAMTPGQGANKETSPVSAVHLPLCHSSVTKLQAPMTSHVEKWCRFCGKMVGR